MITPQKFKDSNTIKKAEIDSAVKKLCKGGDKNKPSAKKPNSSKEGNRKQKESSSKTPTTKMGADYYSVMNTLKAVEKEDQLDEEQEKLNKLNQIITKKPILLKAFDDFRSSNPNDWFDWKSFPADTNGDRQFKILCRVVCPEKKVTSKSHDVKVSTFTSLCINKEYMITKADEMRKLVIKSRNELAKLRTLESNRSNEPQQLLTVTPITVEASKTNISPDEPIAI